MINRRLPLLIGPQVANEDSFFVGPYHYYFLLPFYLFTKGEPIAGAYASVAIGVITSTIAFLITNSLFGFSTGLISGLFFAANPILVSWSAMYTSLFSLIIFYLATKHQFPLAYFLLGLAITTHLASASMLIPVVYVTFFLPPKIKNPSMLILLFIIPFVPIFIFDLRHNFLNLHKIIEFIFIQKSTSNPPLLFLKTFWRSLDFIGSPGFTTASRVLSLFILLLGIKSTTPKTSRVFTFLWTMSPLLALSFYRGNISEYYYGSVTTLIPIFLARLISQIRKEIIIVFILLLFFLIKLSLLIQSYQNITLKTKKNLVSYLINQKRDQFFNLSYDLPAGWNHGYSYLFKFYGKEPKNIPEAHLYTLSLLSNPPSGGELVYQQPPLGIFRR
jgi:hypothetical protein